MGIQVEYNPDLALRNIEEYRKGNRKLEECIPEIIEEGCVYNFLKKGQRNYWFFGEVPLIETKGNEVLSRPKASIIILEVTHFADKGEIWTRGKYKVIESFNDNNVHFECFDKLGTRKDF